MPGTQITVYTKERGTRTLKQGVTLEQYQEIFPNAIEVGISTLEKRKKTRQGDQNVK
jgi:hypothetical protein